MMVTSSIVTTKYSQYATVDLDLIVKTNTEINKVEWLRLYDGVELHQETKSKLKVNDYY